MSDVHTFIVSAEELDHTSLVKLPFGLDCILYRHSME